MTGTRDKGYGLKRAPGTRDMVKNKQGYGKFRAGTREIMKNEQGQGIWVSSRDNYFLIYFWQ